MTGPQKTHRREMLPPGQPRQISMAFESTGLLGLTSAERAKAVTRLAYLLMLAAGLAGTECDDER
ncbi:MAG: hypothetical protein ACREU2_15825 [Steroidobacteraceae bacterium]